MKNKAVNVEEKLAKVSEYWTPKIIEQVNDYQIKVAKFKGEFSWHDHKDADEVFMVIEGKMSIMFRNSCVNLNEGEIYVVPKGVEHKPVADTECHVILIEPEGTVNTGDIINEQTASSKDWI